jgi:hypothetical protein
MHREDGQEEHLRPQAASSTAARDYLYDHVTSKVLGEDLDFGDDAPGPGDRLPGFDLPTATGERLRSRDVVGHEPLLLVFGSVTCPMTASSVPSLKRLHATFGDRIAFVMVYVREAHPGENFPQPRTLEQKLEHARSLIERDDIPWPVAIDDPDGTLHRAMDGKPNAAFLSDRSGEIVFRALWAGDEHSLRQALEAVARGERPPEPESRRRFVPMAKGMGEMREVLHQAGPRAERDIWRAAPPMGLTAWAANVFRPLPPQWRTFAALATFGVVCGAVGALLARRRRH